MVLDYVLFVLGIPLLWKGADLLVDGSVRLATHFGVSSLIVGLTVVSFGTSAPELFVNVLAAVRGDTDIALGNVIGSNIANTLLVLGAGALIHRLAVRRTTIRTEIPFSFLAAILVLLLANDQFFDGSTPRLSRGDGLVLILFFSVFVWYLVYLALRTRAKVELEQPRMNTWMAAGSIVGGLVALAAGSDWLVRGAVTIALDLGVSQAFVGLLLVALGTSLPELATTAVGAFKGEADLVVGNIVGSNVFNLLWVLGVAAAIRPMPFSASLNADLAVVAGSSVVLLLFLRRPMRFNTWHGWTLISGYAAYIVFLLVRQ